MLTSELETQKSCLVSLTSTIVRQHSDLAALSIGPGQHFLVCDCVCTFYMAVLRSMCVYFFLCVCVLFTMEPGQQCIPSSIVQLDVSINFCIAGFHQLQLMVIEGTMQWSCSRYFLSLIFLHFPWLVSCVWQFQFCRLMLSNSIIASHCCGSVAVFHNSLAAERHSSVKDEIQPRSCESYYRTLTVVNGNSYLWITVWITVQASFVFVTASSSFFWLYHLTCRLHNFQR